MVNALSIRDLNVTTPEGKALLNGVGFDIAPGEQVALVGESGSGKSVTAAALCGLLRPPLKLVCGKMAVNGGDMVHASARTWRQKRGREIFQIFQSPASALTPARRVGVQLHEAVRIAGFEKGRQAAQVVKTALGQVALSTSVQDQFPYQLSGGMRQRVLIAMALILRPAVLIADEPTTGLDVLTEIEVLGAMRQMVSETGAALLFISHDLRAVRAVADRVLVLNNGSIVEDSPTQKLGHSGVPAARALVEAAEALADPC